MSAKAIDYDTYLLPISKESPCGKSLRYDPIFDAIVSARKQEDVSLPQGVWKREFKFADWSAVHNLCDDVLKNQSKDLQVAAWLAEAWLHERGIRGFGDGIFLMHKLCVTYWDSIHPIIDADGCDYRLSPILWLNEKMSEQMGLYAISNPDNDSSSYYSLGEYEYLQNHGNKVKSKPVSGHEKEMSLDALQTSMKATANYFYEILYKDTLRTIDLIENFEAFLVEKLPAEGVSLYQLRASLGKFRDCMLSVLKERDLLSGQPKTINLQPTQETEVLTMKDETTQNNKIAGQDSLESREQAYQMLAEIAKYLESIEPHSPTPYLLKKAITWGNMPLSSLLQEYIENNMDFAQLQRWLGIPNPQTPDKERMAL